MRLGRKRTFRGKNDESCLQIFKRVPHERRKNHFDLLEEDKTRSNEEKLQSRFGFTIKRNSVQITTDPAR